MNAVERIKQICKERKIPISRLEKDLGFANGYISQIRTGNIRGDRLAAIAEYFGVTVSYLLTGENEKAPSIDGEREISDADIQAAFWGGYKGLTQEQIDAMWQDVREYAAYIAEKERKKKK